MADPTVPEPRRAAPSAGLSGTIYDAAVRGALVASGAGLLIGFFLPWLHVGGAVSMSGLSLLVTQGEATSVLSGPKRVMLLAVPLLGVALLLGAFYGRRVAAWVGLVVGVTLIACGVFTLLSVFLDTTGSGMWLVVACALFAFGAGLFGVSRSTKVTGSGS